MGTITGSKIIAMASEVVLDSGNVTWKVPQGVEWINDAQRAIALHRPDASIQTSSVKLVAGVDQSITGRRLLTVVRNMGADGNTPGKAIRLVERGAKDDFEPDWPTLTEETEIKEYMYDARVPKEFMVSPPVSSTTNVYVRLTQAVDPTDITDENDTINLDDVYAPVIVEWLLYRWFSRDSEETPNWQRAARHYQSFFNLLGIKIEMDKLVNPKLRAHLK